MSDLSQLHILRTGSTEEWHYPNKYYSLRYDTAPYTPVEVRKNIYAGDKLVASVQGTSTEAQVFYNHLDHLGSTRVVTEYDGDTVEVTDYYPFGATRVSDRYAEFSPKKKYSGHEWDEEVGIYYMGARYYEPEVKRFLSQDPAHLLVGDQRFESKFGVALQSHLGEPQNLNSYSYAVNNPIKFKDKDGKYVETAIDVAALGLSLHELQKAQESGEGVGWATVDVALDSIAVALPFVPAGGGAARRALVDAGKKFFGGGGGGPCSNCIRGGGGGSVNNNLRWLNDSSSFGSNYTRFVSTQNGIVDLRPTIERIKAGDSFPHKNDGAIFRNREGKLPQKTKNNYYREYVVETPGLSGPGQQRLVVGKGGEIYYSPDHYRSFTPVGH